MAEVGCMCVLGWMDGVKAALNGKMMTVEVARPYAQDSKEC